MERLKIPVSGFHSQYSHKNGVTSTEWSFFFFLFFFLLLPVSID